MSVDLAQLGFEVDSTGAVVATRNLKRMSEAANDATDDQDKLARSSDRASKAQKRLADAAKRYGRVIGAAAKIAAVAMAAMAGNSIRLAVAAEETASKFQVVFRGSVESANAQLVEMSKTIPLTITQMRGLASGVQDMLVPMGLARDAAAGLSIEAVQLAGDIASFNDVSADTILENIQSALAGSSEPLRKYGVDVRETRLKTLAYEKGLISLGEELTTAARAQAVFIAINEDSADAMGDAERTMMSAANQMRFLRRDFVQAQEDLGRLLIPAFGQLLTAINRVDTDGLTPLQRAMRSISTFILTFTKYVMLLVAGLLQLITMATKAKNAILNIPSISLPTMGMGMGGVGGTYAAGGVSAEEVERQAAAVREGVEDVRQSNAELDAELQASLDSIFATISGIDDAIAQMAEGVDRSLEDVRAGMDGTGEALTGLVPLTLEETKALAKLTDALDPVGKEMEYLADMGSLLEKALAAKDINLAQYAKLRRALARTSEAYNRAQDAAMQLKQMDVVVQANLESNMDYIDSLVEMRDQVGQIEDSLDPASAALRDLAEQKDAVNKAFAEGAIEKDVFERVVKSIDKATDALTGMDAIFTQAIGDWIVALRDMAGMFDRDSQEAKDLHRIITLLNVVMGVYAVIKQLAEGDVYSAIPRALSVAAMVAGMGVQTGAGGGSISISERRQEQQGTGTVLGDAEAKTESIIKATEITATATSELVGINRGMLQALQAMQAGIAGATGSIARGGEADFGKFNFNDQGSQIAGALVGGIGGWMAGAGMGWWLGALGGPIGMLLGAVLGSVLGKLLGGSSKVIDEGVAILGGNLQQAMDGEMVQAFQTVKYKKWRWGSSKKKDVFGPLGEEATNQISLVFQAIGDTVHAGALALGMEAEAIEAAMATFEVAATQISFEGLSAEEQQAELEAVFGQIFDNLASHVIPYIVDFQQVGEGLGETLVRVATSVQVFKESVSALGFAADESDPEAFAHMAVGLVELTGGVSEFIAQFTTFFEKFANDEQQLEFLTSQLSRAFESVGLTIPDARDGMVDLMQSLDATTEAGRQQIAMLLEIAGVASEYYALIESSEEARLKQAQEMAAMLAGYRDTMDSFIGSGTYAPLVQLRDAFDEAMDAADALGASQREYAMIARSFDMQLKRMAAGLRLNIMSMAEELFGSDTTDTITDGFEETRMVANSVFDEWQRALESIYEYTQSLLLDEQLTTLTPAEQLGEAQSQFDRVLAAAMGGDVEAAAALPDAANALLEEARFMYASGSEYTKIFDSVRKSLDRVKTPSGVDPMIEETDPTAGYRMQGEIIGDGVVTALERYLMAFDLAVELRNLADVIGVSVLDLAEELGIPLYELVSALGVNIDQLTNTTAAELAEVAQILGIGFFELIAALNISLDQLSVATGFELDKLGKTVYSEVAKFAEMLGISITSVLNALGVEISNSLGKVIDSGALDPKLIGDAIDPPNPYAKKKVYNAYKKGFATGGYVGQTGMHQLHAGEFVINRGANNVSPAGDNQLSSAELSEIRLVLSDIRDQQRRYQEANLEASRGIESGVKDQVEQYRRVANSG